MSSEQEISDRWIELIDNQVLVPDSIDEDSEIVYVVDQERLKEYDPILYQEYHDDLATHLASLVSKGLMDVSLNADGELVYVPATAESWIESKFG